MDALATTRTALHAVAEQVLAGARYRAVGRIGLHVTATGFATPDFDGRVLAVDGAELVVADGDSEHRFPLTTLREVAAAAGTEPGAPDSYPAATSLDPDAPLAIDPDAARRLADWRALGDSALRETAIELGHAELIPPILWPEHFDVGIRINEVNFGCSLGDEAVAQPYLYVGPNPPFDDDPFWNAPWGSSRTWDEVPDLEAAKAHLLDGAHRASRIGR